MISVCLLGATGSIGSQLLELIADDDNYQLVAFAFGKNTAKALEIIEKFKPRLVSCEGRAIELQIKAAYPSLEVRTGNAGLQAVASYPCSNPLVVNALVGSIGLIPTIAALENGRDVLLANKETLVIGGEIVMKKARERNAKIIPIDSEHSAIFQLMNGKSFEEVRKIILTASGGSLRHYSKSELINVTVEEALAHPNWSMGNKITIDSATMMNKGFEIIEAHYLFNLPLAKISTIIHPESIIHSMVEFNDGSIFAQLGPSDMRLPIQYALKYPNHQTCDIINALDLMKTGSLHFEELSEERFPLISLAKEMLNKGSIHPTVLNACNEACVKLFLDKKITFNQIEEIIFETVNDCFYHNFIDGELTIIKIMMVDELTKNYVNQKYDK